MYSTAVAGGRTRAVLRSVLSKDVASRPDAEFLDQLLAEAAGERSRTVLPAPKTPTVGHEAQLTPAADDAGGPADALPATVTLKAPLAAAQVPSKDGRVWDYFEYQDEYGTVRVYADASGKVIRRSTPC